MRIAKVSLPTTNPTAANACSDWTKGLEISGPSIVFINPLSVRSNDPEANVKSP